MCCYIIQTIKPRYTYHFSLQDYTQHFVRNLFTCFLRCDTIILEFFLRFFEMWEICSSFWFHSFSYPHTHIQCDELRAGSNGLWKTQLSVLATRQVNLHGTGRRRKTQDSEYILYTYNVFLEIPKNLWMHSFNDRHWQFRQFFLTKIVSHFNISSLLLLRPRSKEFKYEYFVTFKFILLAFSIFCSDFSVTF